VVHIDFGQLQFLYANDEPIDAAANALFCDHEANLEQTFEPQVEGFGEPDLVNPKDDLFGALAAEYVVLVSFAHSHIDQFLSTVPL